MEQRLKYSASSIIDIGDGLAIKIGGKKFTEPLSHP